MTRYKHLFIPFIFFFVLSNGSFAASPPMSYSKEGMVTSRSSLASDVGIEIMNLGGNAIDAAVATGFALAVTYPSAGNLGGGSFIVARTQDGQTFALDARETAPSNAHRDMYLDKDGNYIKADSKYTHLASGVPGTVDGFITLHKRFGKLPLHTVLAPAIRLADEGFPLSYELITQFEKQLPHFKKHAASLTKFTHNGKPYTLNQTWRQPELAKTLKAIASKGRDGFYQGVIAKKIVQEMQRGNGIMTLKDLASYKSKWRKPITGTYRGYQIVSMPPPSSGGVLLVQMLNMLEQFDLSAMGWSSHHYIHHVVEAERRAYADRAEHLGDPDFFPVPINKLTSKSYAKARLATFQPLKASKSSDISAGSWPKESPDTTHYSVYDKAGNAVSVTTTLNFSYGNKIVVTGAGFLLNNEMDDFSAKPNTPNAYGLIGNKANEIAPHKRMLSSMTPTIVLKNNEPFLITGSPGGSTIITTTMQVILNVIDHGMALNDAVSMPRFHHQWLPDKIMTEPYRISTDSVNLLEKMGHKDIQVTTRKIGDANSIMITPEWIIGASDARGDGGASGK